jgi:hypothetical protein
MLGHADIKQTQRDLNTMDFRPSSRYRLSIICQSDPRKWRARQDSNLRPRD